MTNCLLKLLILDTDIAIIPLDVRDTQLVIDFHCWIVVYYFCLFWSAGLCQAFSQVYRFDHRLDSSWRLDCRFLWIYRLLNHKLTNRVGRLLSNNYVRLGHNFFLSNRGCIQCFSFFNTCKIFCCCFFFIRILFILWNLFIIFSFLFRLFYSIV